MRKYIDAEALKHKSIEIPFNGKFHKVIPLGEFDTIPAADVRPVVKARWNVGADGWECSNCTIESNNTYPICPYCGAEMMEES